jgi:hypothetical protein
MGGDGIEPPTRCVPSISRASPVVVDRRSEAGLATNTLDVPDAVLAYDVRDPDEPSEIVVPEVSWDAPPGTTIRGDRD